MQKATFQSFSATARPQIQFPPPKTFFVTRISCQRQNRKFSIKKHIIVNSMLSIFLAVLDVIMFFAEVARRRRDLWNIAITTFAFLSSLTETGAARNGFPNMLFGVPANTQFCKPLKIRKNQFVEILQILFQKVYELNNDISCGICWTFCQNLCKMSKFSKIVKLL